MILFFSLLLRPLYKDVPSYKVRHINAIFLKLIGKWQNVAGNKPNHQASGAG
jgi:hypothetical protein